MTHGRILEGSEAPAFNRAGRAFAVQFRDGHREGFSSFSGCAQAAYNRRRDIECVEIWVKHYDYGPGAEDAVVLEKTGGLRFQARSTIESSMNYCLADALERAGG